MANANGKSQFVADRSVNKNSVSWSKKELENFESNLRIITKEEHLRKLWELFYPLEIKTQFIHFWGKGLYIKWCIRDSLHNPELSAIVVDLSRSSL